MKISDFFVSKHPTHKAVLLAEWHRYDRVIFDGTVYFYDLPYGLNAEDFAAAVSAAFDEDVDPRDVTLDDAGYRVDL